MVEDNKSKMIPIRSQWDREFRCSRLWFIGDEMDEKVNKGRPFHMRGGVCWPRLENTYEGIAISGFAVMVGVNLLTDRLLVFEQTPFMCVDHILRDDGGIAVEGLCDWFNTNWERYAAQHYYYHQKEEMNRKYMVETARSRLVKTPKPTFTEVEWDVKETPLHTIWQHIELDRLGVEHGSLIYRAIDVYRIGDEASGPIHALACAVEGISRFPWKNRANKELT